jgi:aspartyl-tRNA(Asn)/glutamyl-tRNA(Gln) amidotransferase subunit C
MKVTSKDVAYVADLANLELRPEEMRALEHDLNEILDYVAQLERLDTEGAAPMSHVLGGRDAEQVSQATLREDVLRKWFDTAQALANAPSSGAGFFKVPRIIERQG